jgi:hypothetical protein
MTKRLTVLLLLTVLAIGVGASTYNVRDFRAKGDGLTLDHAAINQAIEKACNNGGGRVVLPAGTYLCGSIRLKSNVELHLMAGARILAAPAAMKAYDKSEVVKRIIELIQDYMDIRRHFMGEDIFLGDLEKEIAKLDGVVNLVSLRCVNKTGDGYSNEIINQTTVDQNICTNIERAESLGYDASELEVDLLDSDKTLYSSIDTMFEIKYPSRDITVRNKSK